MNFIIAFNFTSVFLMACRSWLVFKTVSTKHIYIYTILKNDTCLTGNYSDHGDVGEATLHICELQVNTTRGRLKAAARYFGLLISDLLPEVMYGCMSNYCTVSNSEAHG